MFTGIVEALGRVERSEIHGENRSFWVKSPLHAQLKVDQSLLHNGICLTVEAVSDGLHRVTAIAETARKTDVGTWGEGTLLNLERSMTLQSLLDGHLVQGHVDTIGTCQYVREENGSWLYRIHFPKQFSHLVIEKGSIALNGISLTVFDLAEDAFSVAIIPYTYQHTNIQDVRPGSAVNLEFDVVGKYIARKLSISNS